MTNGIYGPQSDLDAAFQIDHVSRHLQGGSELLILGRPNRTSCPAEYSTDRELPASAPWRVKIAISGPWSLWIETYTMVVSTSNFKRIREDYPHVRSCAT